MPQATATQPARAETRDDAVRRERTRILTTLLDDLERVVAGSVALIRAKIPAYAAASDERLLDDVTDQVRKHHRITLISLLEDRAVELDEIAFVRGAAMRRARAGFALEDYINAYRVGQQNLWDSIVEIAGDSQAAQQAALTLATPLMRYVDFASTHAGHAYVEFRQYAVAEANRERRDLLEHLLAGELASRGPLVRLAQSYGIGAESRLLVATAVPAGAEVDGDGLYVACTALAHAGWHETSTLVVPRRTEIVAVPVLGPDGDPEPLCARLEAVVERLREDGVPLAMGISTAAMGVAELPRAYDEAELARECLPPAGGVSALPRLSPFEYLALRGDATARRLIDPRLRAFLDEDRARGGAMLATIRAYADADLVLRAAAERLQVHPNTAKYRLRRIEERTGRDPRRIADLLELLVAIALSAADNGRATTLGPGDEELGRSPIVPSRGGRG